MKQIITKESEELLAAVFSNISDLIAITDVNGVRLSVSKSYQNLLGDKTELIGKKVFREIHSDDQEKFISFFKQTTKEGIATDIGIEYRILLPDGSPRSLSAKMSCIYDDTGKTKNIVIVSADNTDRMRSEKEIRLLAHAVSCTKDSFLLTDLENNLLFTNPTTCEMYGYKEEELLGKNIEMLYSPCNSKELVRQIHSETLKGGWNGEIFHRRNDGTDFPVELWTSVVRDDDGHPLATVCVAHNVSVRKQAEERYNELSQQLGLTIDNLDLFVHELDADGKILLSRGKGLEKLGLTPDQVNGVSAYDLYKDNSSVLEMLKKAYTNISGKLDIEIAGNFWNANFLPVLNEVGEVDRVFITSIDITERKYAEEALRHESELWHTMMENIPDTIYFKDIDSRFTRINKAQAEILGVNKVEDAIGKTDFDFFAAGHAEVAIKDEREIIKSGKAMVGKPEQVGTKDGRIRWFSTTKVPIRNQVGNVIGIVGSSRDITELKQAQELESVLYRIAAEAGSAGDIQKLFSTIHGIIGELMFVKNFYFALYDKKNDILTFPYFVDEVDIPPESGTAGNGLTAYVLRTGKSLLCDQKVSDELERAGEAELVGVPCPIWLGVPLIVEGNTIGAMVVQHYTDPAAYGEREKHILEFVSTQVAKAIERKQAQQALKLSEDRYRAFVEQSTEGIWRFDSEVPVPITLKPEEQIEQFFKYFYLAECNDAMAQMYGFEHADEIKGRRLDDMLVGNDPQNYEMFGNFIRSNYRLTQAESHELDRNGIVKYFLNNFVGIIGDNMIVGWWGTQIDITERRNAEELLIDSEEKYRALFEESQDCIILSAADGKLVDINPAGVELFGYSSEQELLKQRTAPDLYFYPEDRESFINHLSQFRFVKDLEVSVKRKDGEKRIVLENATSVKDTDGKVIAYRSFLRDITERKKLEGQLRQAQKMESIGTLAGGIAHDFNNILGIILGYTTLLENSATDRQRVDQSLNIIKKAVQRGADLVRQLLTFARKGEPSFTLLEINDVVTELIRMLNQTFPKAITIVSKLFSDPQGIVADSSQLHLALLNLCVNARDAMIEDKPGSAGGGTLTLKTGIVHRSGILEKFPEASDDNYVFISISDTGIGMDEETRSRMFEPFFTTKELGKGTGLGLAVVYGVISSHHGFVDVESVKGIGSTFTLYFPAVEKKADIVEPSVTAEVPHGVGSETILIVEDEEMLAALLSSILSDQGYRVLTAKDGIYGIEIFKSNKDKIDLVLSDMGLPRLGGYEMFMQMKEIQPNLRAILASGYFDPNLKKELIDAGAKDFIQKPYVPELIIQRIREILDEERK